MLLDFNELLSLGRAVGEMNKLFSATTSSQSRMAIASLSICATVTPLALGSSFL